MIQSPLMPNAATQALENGTEMAMDPETLAVKPHVLGLVNTFIRQDFKVVGGEALRAVIHLVILEVHFLPWVDV